VSVSFNQEHQTTNQQQTMIIKDTETTLETIGTIQDEAQFKMRTSQKAFQILSSLYSDKALAIVRELGCNAMDSHIASGQPTRPFHIHIPNALEPWLTIQDFGTGISHENIYEIYSTYFASTKTNTNTQVGMLGLGSKSPFCYTDNFTITSRHLGIKRIYNAYFNQKGMPTISLASQENTQDENGVEIQIPVKQSDMGEFTEAIWKAFRFFDTKPTISGGSVDWTDKCDFEGSFWKSYTSLNQSYAVMGGVVYPIDTYKIASEHYDIIRKAGLVIKFAIGELDVTPSREALMYHDWVVQALNDKITQVKKDFVAKVEDQIKNSDNLLDAMKALYLLNNQWSFLNSTLISGKVMWKNIEITEPRKSIKNLCQNNLKSYCKRVWGRAKWSESEYASLDSNALWYVDDIKRGSIKRTIAFIKSHANSNISVNLVDNTGMVALIKAGFPASVFIPTSTLPAIASSKASSGKGNTRPKGIINLYEVGYGYRQSWEAESFDLSTGTAPKYYIVKDTKGWEFEKMQLTSKDGKVLMTIADKSSLIDYCKFAGINMSDDVRMVSKNNAQHIEKLGSVPLSDSVKKKIVDVDWEAIQIVKNISTRTAQELKKHKLFGQLSDTNPLKIFVDKIINAIKESGKLEQIKNYIRTDEKFELTFPSNLVRLIYLGSDNWQIGVESALKAALEMDNQ
jgi:hypothetical protein